MILDRTLLFSDAQAITADAASTNVLDQGAMGTVYGAATALTFSGGKGTKIPLLIQVVESFDALTSMQVSVQCAVDAAFTSPKTLLLTGQIPLSDLKAGKQFPIDVIPRGDDQRYLRLFYDITGSTPSVGKITAGVVAGIQSAYAGA